MAKKGKDRIALSSDLKGDNVTMGEIRLRLKELLLTADPKIVSVLRPKIVKELAKYKVDRVSEIPFNKRIAFFNKLAYFKKYLRK